MYLFYCFSSIRDSSVCKYAHMTWFFLNEQMDASSICAKQSVLAFICTNPLLNHNRAHPHRVKYHTGINVLTAMNQMTHFKISNVFITQLCYTFARGAHSCSLALFYCVSRYRSNAEKVFFKVIVPHLQAENRK